MIKFWRTSGKYGAFSNFAPFGLFLDGKYYKTSEHYYQAQKFADENLQEQVRLASNPKGSKIVANELLGDQRRADWESVKYGIMKKCLLAKFQQHASLKELLLSTGDEEIAEDSPYDYVWGIGKDGSGQNLLGKALMEVREELKEST